MNKIINMVRPGGIILLNRERVLYETFELARLRIARRLKIEPIKIDVVVDTGEDKQIKVKFKIADDATKGKTEEEVKSIVAQEHKQGWEILNLRLSGLGEKRNGAA